MKNILLLLVVLCSSIFTFSQNVGVGNTSPTHTLHITPNQGDDPLRIDGLNTYASENHLIVIDTTTGVIKKMPIDSLSGFGDTDVDSLVYNSDTLFLYENGKTIKVEVLATGLDTDVDSLVYNNDTLFLYENGKTIKVEVLATGSDTDVDSVVYNSDTLYVYENNKVFKTEIPMPTGGGGAAGYDTTEYLTGKVWIDGKPVYGRVIHNYTAPIPTIDLSSYFTSNYIQTLLDFRIISDCSATLNQSVHHSSYASFGYNVVTNLIGAYNNPSFSSCGGGTYTFIMEYTKQ